MPLFRTHKQLPAFRQITHARKSTPRFIPIPTPQPANCTMPVLATYAIRGVN